MITNRWLPERTHLNDVRIPKDIFKRIGFLSGNRKALACSCKTLYELFNDLNYVMTLPYNFCETKIWSDWKEQGVVIPWIDKIQVLNLTQLSSDDFKALGLKETPPKWQYDYKSAFQLANDRISLRKNQLFLEQFIRLNEIVIFEHAGAFTGRASEIIGKKFIRITGLFETNVFNKASFEPIFSKFYLTQTQQFFLADLCAKMDGTALAVLQRFDIPLLLECYQFLCQSSYMKALLSQLDRIHLLYLLEKLRIPVVFTLIKKIYSLKERDSILNSQYFILPNYKNVDGVLLEISTSNGVEIIDLLVEKLEGFEHNWCETRFGFAHLKYGNAFMAILNVLTRFIRRDRLLILKRFFPFFDSFLAKEAFINTINDFGLSEESKRNKKISGRNTVDCTEKIFEQAFAVRNKKISGRNTVDCTEKIFEQAFAVIAKHTAFLDDLQFEELLKFLSEKDIYLNLFDEEASHTFKIALENIDTNVSLENDWNDSRAMIEKPACTIL